MGTPLQVTDGAALWTPVTDRGTYLKAQMKRAGMSARGLGRTWAEARAKTPLDTDDPASKTRRRALRRYLDDGRDVSDLTVAELSPLLGVTPEAWPPKRPHHMERLRAELAELRGQVAEETRQDVARDTPLEDDGEP